MSDKIQLRDPRPTKVIELPSFPGSKVEIWPYLMLRDLSGIDVSSADASKNIEQGLKVLPRLIKSWNFTDEKNADMPINEESVKMLSTEDVIFLFGQIEALAKEQKKSSTT